MLGTLVIWSLIIFYQAELTLGIATPRTVQLTMFYLPAKYDSTMLAFLESEYEGLPMKKILEAVAIQENATIWLEGKSINATIASEGFLSPRMSKSFILKIVLPDKEIMIIKNNIISSIEKPTSVQESSTKLFLLNGEVVDLKLLVRD
jgi:hypothetical protein